MLTELKRIKFVTFAIMAIATISILTVISCSSETETVEVIKEVEVEKIVEVPGETVTETVEIEKIVEVAGATVTETVEVAADPGKLVVYSGRKESLIGNIVQQFEYVTGIDVEIKYGSTMPVALMILEEGDNSPADVFIAQDPGGLGFLSDEGRLSVLPADITGPVQEWAKPSDGTWVGLSGRARSLVHTATLSADELPASLEDLTDPKWKGKIGWAPKNTSFQTMITGMRAMWGEEKTRTWLEDMLKNEPIVYPKNTPQVAAAAVEEISIGLVNHYYLHRFLSAEGDDFNARNLYLSNGGPGSLVMVAGAGIVNTASNTENAAKFIKFMTSPVAQQYFSGQIYEYPVVDGVKASRLIPAFADLNMAPLTPDQLSDLTGTQAIFTELGMLE